MKVSCLVLQINVPWHNRWSATGITVCWLRRLVTRSRFHLNLRSPYLASPLLLDYYLVPIRQKHWGTFSVSSAIRRFRGANCQIFLCIIEPKTVILMYTDHISENKGEILQGNFQMSSQVVFCWWHVTSSLQSWQPMRPTYTGWAKKPHQTHGHNFVKS